MTDAIIFWMQLTDPIKSKSFGKTVSVSGTGEQAQGGKEGQEKSW